MITRIKRSVSARINAYKYRILGKIDNYIFLKNDEYLNKFFFGLNKWGVNLGSDSYFKLPLEITGGDRIFIGDNSSIGKNAWLGAFESYYIYSGYSPFINIGDGVKIGNYACITSIKSIIIHNGCQISEFFYVSDHYHGFDAADNISPFKQPLYVKGEGVEIGENCFIGYRVTILPGIQLGKHCVVGSHSVVTKSFPDYSMIAGAPAKLIKQYDLSLKQWVEVDKAITRS